MHLATRTVGAVVQPGAILLTLVPANDMLRAEVWLGDHTVMDYLLSPVKKAWHEAGRER